MCFIARNIASFPAASQLIRNAPSHLTGEKRVGHPLLPEARAGAVAADEADVIAERQQLVLDRTDQGGMAAAGQVGAADRAVEQDVADMREAQAPIEKDDAAGRVAGAVQDLEGQLADADRVAFLEPAVGREVA